MSATVGSYKVVSPIGKSSAKRVPLAAPIPDLSGKTVCAGALRYKFRTDETFPILEGLLRERYANIRFIPHYEMPDLGLSSQEQETQLTRALKEKGCDVLLAGNGA